MAHNLHRAALAVLCVFAVIFAATLFPATGFGSNPVPEGGIGDGAGAGDARPGDSNSGGQPTATAQTSAGTTTRTATADDRGTAAATTDGSKGTAGTGSNDAMTGTTTDTPTTATTTTASQAYEHSADGGLMGSLLAIVSILATVVVTVVALAVGFGRHHRHRYPSDWDLPNAPHLRLLAYVRRIPQTSLAFAMFAGSNAPGILDQLGASVGEATTGFGAALDGIGKLGSTIGTGLLKVPAGFISGIGALGEGLGSVTLALPSLSTGISSGGFFGSGADRPGADPRSGGRPDPVEPEPEDPDPPGSVREAWERLQDDLGVDGADGETPGEIARRAVDRGVPSNAAGKLTRAFRDVRYGGHPDDGERVTVARKAYERIKTALDGDSS